MFDEIDDLTDAIIEDTCRCDLCGASFVLGGNDYVIVNGGEVRFRDGCSGAFCAGCAAVIHKAYEELCREAGVCVHGTNKGEHCDECSADWNEMPPP